MQWWVILGIVGALLVSPILSAAETSGEPVGVEMIWPMIEDLNLVQDGDDCHLFTNLTHMNGKNFLWKVWLNLTTDDEVTNSLHFQRMGEQDHNAQATDQFSVVLGEDILNPTTSSVNYYEAGGTSDGGYVTDVRAAISLGIHFAFECVDYDHFDLTVLDIAEQRAEIGVDTPSGSEDVGILGWSPILPLAALGVAVTVLVWSRRPN